jgi:hypothetical protein
VDYDADGDLDILAGTYTGELYFYEGLGAGAFRQGQLMRNVEGVPIDCTPTGLFAMAATPEAVDIDADGDLDLVVGAGHGGVRVIENQGTRAEPVWATEVGKLKTAVGKQIEGNVHHADWNGDGVRDLVVGSLDGSIGWHKNLGRNDLPSYGERIALLEKRGPEKFDVGTVPSRPSYRTKVHVTDYNDDGLVDLLVGDVADLFHPAPPLSAAQKQEMADLRPAHDAAKKIREAVLAEYNAARNKGSVPPELKERLKTTWQAFRPLKEQMEAFTLRERDKTHGFVFLYLGGRTD